MPLAQLILASTSPRRKELLSLIGRPFRVQPAKLNEDVRRWERPQDYVARLAREKARLVANRLEGEDALVLAADTTVVLGGKILGKPANFDEARHMLSELRGRTHTVYTGISLVRIADDAALSDLATTEVPMRNYSDEEMSAYVAGGDPLDKAGGYAIQHAGFHPVEKMAGCFANVVGLPLCHLQRTFQKWDLRFEVDLPAACQRHLAYECPVTEKILNWEL